MNRFVRMQSNDRALRKTYMYMGLRDITLKQEGKKDQDCGKPAGQ